MNDFPTLAPRGKWFAVSRFSHVAGGPVPPCLVIEPQRFNARTEAEGRASRVDRRLDPRVMLCYEPRSSTTEPDVLG